VTRDAAEIDRRLAGYELAEPVGTDLFGFVLTVLRDLGGAADHLRAVEAARRNHCAAEGADL